MEKIEQIEAEIKRKYKSYEKILNKNINPFLSFSLVSRIEECKSVLSFIDSLGEPKSKSIDIDIPFGASDSELMEATYFIPQGYNAVIDGNKVIIKKGVEPVSNNLEEAVEAVIHPYDGEIWVDKDLLSIYDDCQRVKLIIIEEE